MHRDSIFYRLFQRSPSLLFALLPDPPANAAAYRFDAVAVKEPTFEIDGVFLPPTTDGTGVVYFCEVQFQKDETLYERLFAELFLYFYRQRSQFADWQAVILYPQRQLEQRAIAPYAVLLDSPKVHRIYLDELGPIRELPLGLALMVLTTLNPAIAPTEARHILQRTTEEMPANSEQRAIIEMVTTIMVYKFARLSRREVEAMLGIRLEETQVYREAKQEGRAEGQAAEGQTLVIRLLTRRLGTLPATLQQQIQALSLPQIEALAEALLDFEDMTALEHWLQHHSG